MANPEGAQSRMLAFLSIVFFKSTEECVCVCVCVEVNQQQPSDMVTGTDRYTKK